MTPESFARCQELLREAIRLDPDFAPAYAQLADSFSSLIWWADLPPAEGMAQATPLLDQALSLDPELAHAHSVIGVVQGFMVRDRAAGEGELRRAVELAPNDAMAHTYLALFLGLVKGDRWGAMEQVRVALRLDPLSPAMRTWAGYILLSCGRLEEGIQTLEDQVAATPYFWMPRYFLSLGYATSGRLPEARAAAERASELSAENSISLSLVACLAALAGDQGGSDAALERLKRRAETRYVPPMCLAWAHASRGETEAGLRRVEEALAAKDPWVSSHASFYSLGILTPEPRFDALIASAFPQGADIPPPPGGATGG
jgi:serine/threonine-protein kinase